MNRAVNIAVVGDYRADNETHVATTAALEHSAGAANAKVDTVWVPTPDVDGRAAAALAGCDGVLIAPGSPYASMAGALDAITWARTTGVPLLGTCGGFQHVVIEFARLVADIADADHAEHDPTASCLVVDRLACSLVGQRMQVTLVRDTTAHRAYRAAHAVERYYCQFGLNPRYVEPLLAAGLTISGIDADDEPRVVELPDHPFFVATLFVPQISSAPDAPHPLVSAFVAAAMTRRTNAA